MASPRDLPALDRLIGAPQLVGLPRPLVVDAARRVLASARAAILAGGDAPTLEGLTETVVAEVAVDALPRLRTAINATGVVIQTNLGRAPVSRAAAEAMAAVAASYSNLEYDLDRGERGSRTTHLEPLLRDLSGAEAALAVNNNAAALLLALAALAAGREVAIARGQLVEIGGGFRIPDVMRQSGARLVEVGTTNRTYARDYVEATSPDTAALLRVHSSNFRIVGFTHEASLADLVAVARERGLVTIDDLGSGSFLDTAEYGLAHEPTVAESVAAGADVVCFSGDKLLGGPQAGILVGRKESIDKLKRHPLARAVRLDKASIAGLEATLRHYRRGEATQEIPIWRMIAARPDELERRAQVWADALAGTALAATVEHGESAVGGGSLPGETLPTRLLALRARSVEALAASLRRGRIPLIGRIERDRLLLDPRTVLPEQDTVVKQLLVELPARGSEI
jgi:L-seryl-tRNA(Ser) seleniumtransferase